ncbi:hypothetical protein E1B28_002887 [Marasmius oreades]|uniref:DUF6535 domain-containing protein n=1 Tax=Marasmius oreades TaxID=181124 RepID=A0A9P7UNI6_9AGAR|nr:uncharacterized protein E1B28_002887 [Marasmius oreades]KAG7086971.1 hypothetical protein E1B28_002887 [Marasmius oreades]
MNEPQSHFIKKSTDTLGQDDVHERTEDSSDGNKNTKVPDPKLVNEPRKENEPAVNKEKPTIQQSWEAAMKKVDIIDGDLVQGYKEDIDTLLVFAGLFSAVVTAFTVESYQWLQDDPAEITSMLLNSTVVLLTQIAQQNGSNQSPLPSSPPAFAPTPSAIRINTFWFLSLTLALVDALFGLLCKQWLREHQRQTNTHTPDQALALRWLRHQSFEKWHVSKILVSLPILLEIALFLFFAGILDLLWTRHTVPFAIALVVVGLATLFYLMTTILPGLSMIRQVLQIQPYSAFGFPLDPQKMYSLPAVDLICPYKSPQSWLAFRLLSAIFRLGRHKGFLYSFILKFNPSWRCYGPDPQTVFNTVVSKNILDVAAWPSFDLNLIQRFSSIERCPDLYGLKGLRWLVQETRDTPSMIPHLKNVLARTPLHLIMPTVFDCWDSPVVFDFESAFESPRTRIIEDLFDDRWSEHDLALTCQIVAFRHLLTTSGHDSLESGRLETAAERLWHRILGERVNGRFAYALFCPEESLLAPSKASGHINALNFYTRHWDQVDIPTQVRLVERLSTSILPSLKRLSEHDIGATVLSSRHALKFLTLVNDKIWNKKDFCFDSLHVNSWMDVLRHVRRIHRLPLLYFKPVLGHFPITMDEMKKLLDGSSGSVSEVLEPLLDLCEQCWDNPGSTSSGFEKEGFIKTFASHINDMVSLPAPSGSHPTSSTHVRPQRLSSIGSFIIDSQRGLDFLKFVNEKLVDDISFHFPSRSESIGLWVDALGCVQVFRGLPSDYFKPIPRLNEHAEMMGWYTPRSVLGGIESEEGGRKTEAVNRIPHQDNEKAINEREPPSASPSCEKQGLGAWRNSGAEILATLGGDQVKQPDREGVSEVKGDNRIVAHSIVVGGDGDVGGSGAENNV